MRKLLSYVQIIFYITITDTIQIQCYLKTVEVIFHFFHKQAKLGMCKHLSISIRSISWFKADVNRKPCKYKWVRVEPCVWVYKRDLQHTVRVRQVSNPGSDDVKSAMVKVLVDICYIAVYDKFQPSSECMTDRCWCDSRVEETQYAQTQVCQRPVEWWSMGPGQVHEHGFRGYGD